MKNPDHKSDPFEAAIKRYLDERAMTDPLFAKSYAKPGKSISQCRNFIIAEVRKTGRTAFTNDEIYGLAVHYYDEDNLGDIKPAPKCRIITPAAADGKSQSDGSSAATTTTRPAPKARKTSRAVDVTPSLFDF